MPRFPLSIEHYMSSVIVTAEPSWLAAEAERLMAQHDIRHLPVVEKGRVAGVITQRDILRARADSKAATARRDIAACMHAQPYVVDPEESAVRVAREMARRRIGSAVVAREGKLLGLFTTTDALLALAALLEDERVPGHERIGAPKPEPVKKSAGEREARKPARLERVASPPPKA